jgi:hypothetical protein
MGWSTLEMQAFVICFIASSLYKFLMYAAKDYKTVHHMEDDELARLL